MMRLPRVLMAMVLVITGVVLGATDPAEGQSAPGSAGEAILVAGSTGPPAGDLAIRDLLVDRGHDVTIVDDDSDLSSLDLSDVALLAISTSVSASKVGDVFADAPVPIITWEANLFDDLGLASSPRETSTSHRTIEVVDPSHPIAAGTGPGLVSVHAVAKPLSYGEPGFDAHVIATVPSNPDQATVFGYDEGDVLTTATLAPAPRVALFPSYAGARRLTADGAAIIGAAIDWATEPAPDTRPVNDDFADRTTLTDSDRTSNVGGTLEPGEPVPVPYQNAEASLWWTWTATESGTVTFSTEGSDNDTILAIWTGTELATLELVAVNDDAVGRASVLSLDAEAGTTLQLAVYSYDNRRGTIELAATTTTTPPPYDDFADRIGVDFGVELTNAAATLEVDEPLPPAFASVAEASVWLTWTAPTTGRATVGVGGRSIQPLLAVWEGDELADLVLVGASDLGGVQFDVDAGETYQVSVYGIGNSRGTFRASANVDAQLRPVNDDFADRLPLTGTDSGSYENATFEPGERRPFPSLEDSTESVWWTWTAPSDGAYDITTAGSDFDTVLAVYVGDTLGELELVAVNDNADDATVDDRFSRAGFDAVAGEEYQIAVAGEPNRIGSGSTIVVSAEEATVTRPPNDRFGDRPVLVDEANGTNVDATLDRGEHPIVLGAETSVWWTWTAPRSGTARITTEGSDFDTTLTVWSGTTVPTLELIAWDDDGGPGFTSTVTFDVEMGDSYELSIGGWGRDQGEVVISAAVFGTPVNDDFADQITFTDTTTGNNFEATLEPGEPALPGADAQGSVWWEWTAPVTGTATISTEGSDFNTFVGVWFGDELSTLELVADDVIGPGEEIPPYLHSVVTFDAVAGRTYRVAVYGYFVNRGNIVLSAAVEAGETPHAVLVAGSTGPPAGDRAIADLVRAEGFELSIVDDDSDLSALDLSGVDLLLISTSVTPGKVGNVFADATVPIITWEPQLHDDLALSTPDGLGETPSATRVEVVDPTHPLAAGINGSPLVYTVGKALSFGTPGADADIVAVQPNQPNRAVIFAYDAGDTLVDGSTAPAARVALFPSYGGARRLAPSGVDLISAALAWV